MTRGKDSSRQQKLVQCDWDQEREHIGEVVLPGHKPGFNQLY